MWKRYEKVQKMLIFVYFRKKRPTEQSQNGPMWSKKISIMSEAYVAPIQRALMIQSLLQKMEHPMGGGHGFRNFVTPL